MNDDLFDDIISLEATFHQKGLSDGRSAALSKKEQESYDIVRLAFLLLSTLVGPLAGTADWRRVGILQGLCSWLVTPQYQISR